MSEHRRKPPQGRGGRSAPPSAAGRGPDPARDTASTGAGPAGRAETRRAARGGGRRRAASATGAGAGTATAAGTGNGGRRAARAANASAATGASRRAARTGDPGKKRFIDYPRSGKTGAKRWLPSWRLVTGSTLGFLGLMIVLLGIGLVWVDVPDQAKAAATSQKNVYTWDDGTQMVVAGGGDHNRQNVELPRIAESMQHAVVAAENETFWDDSGIDPMGILRAAGRMALGGSTQSGSTITQQYVKNNYLNPDQTLKRKVNELLISIKVGATESKTDILEGYLNTAYYGRGAYGIQAAARSYFGKDAVNLTESESAFLSSTLNGPNLYDPAGGVGSAATPAKNRKRAEIRWSWTLDRMVETGELSKARRAEIKADGFPKTDKPKSSTELKGQKGYMFRLANSYVTSHTNITKQQLDRGGYTIHTTFNKKNMQRMEESVQDVQEANLKPGERDVDKYVQFGGASVKPGDGAITAIYGGADAVTHWQNNADYTGVTVGSTFKPFVLAAAMRDGVRDPNGPPDQGPDQRTKVSLKSVYNGDNKIKLREYNGETWLNKEGKEWHQPNDGGTDYGRVTLREAMQHSANTPFIQLGVDVGVDKVKQAAVDAGLNDGRSLAPTTPTFSLGTSAPSAIRMANAYGTFAESGLAAEPYSVTKVVREGDTKYEHEKETSSAFEAAVADNVTSSLQTVAQDGTGSKAKALGRPAAVKTGTTDDNKSAWFTGYTPQLSTSIGMWRVNDKAENQEFLPMYGVGGKPKVHGASFPADIWVEYMQKAMKGKKKLPFEKPAPIGDKVYGVGASPSPTPDPTPSEEESPSEEPSETPSDEESPSESTDPSPSESCKFPWDENCQDQGQTAGDGGTDTGADSGTDSGQDAGQDAGQDGGQDGGAGDTGGGGLFSGRGDGAGRPEETEQ